MKFTISNQDLDSLVPVTAQVKRLLDKLKNGQLLMQQELAAKLGVHKRSYNLRSDNPALRDYVVVMQLRKNAVRLWGNKRTIADLRKRQNAINEAA